MISPFYALSRKIALRGISYREAHGIIESNSSFSSHERALRHLLQGSIVKRTVNIGCEPKALKRENGTLHESHKGTPRWGTTGSWSQDPDNYGVLASSMRGCSICQVEHVLVLIAAVSPTLRSRYQMVKGLQGPSNRQRIPLVLLMVEER